LRFHDKQTANNNQSVVFLMGIAKNLAPLVFSVPDFIFWLKEGV
jgi:hypothetical protein